MGDLGIGGLGISIGTPHSHHHYYCDKRKRKRTRTRNFNYICSLIVCLFCLSGVELSENWKVGDLRKLTILWDPGKLDLYVAAGGFHPKRVLPVVLDIGTSNQALLEDPRCWYQHLQCLRGAQDDHKMLNVYYERYLGRKEARLEGDDYYHFIGDHLIRDTCQIILMRDTCQILLTRFSSELNLFFFSTIITMTTTNVSSSPSIW